MIEQNKIYCADSTKLITEIDSNSVDLIFIDSIRTLPNSDMPHMIDCHRILKDGGTFCLFCQAQSEDTLSVKVDTLSRIGFGFSYTVKIYDQTPTGYDEIMVCYKGDKQYRSKDYIEHKIITDQRPNIGKYDTTESLMFSITAMERSVELYKKLISNFTEEGMLVIDLYANSFVAIEAAIVLNRRYIGCDDSFDKYEIATKRLKGLEK